MFIRSSKHRALMAHLQEERDVIGARNRLLESANKQLNQEVLALHKFIESEGLHQRHCKRYLEGAFGRDCDCRLSRAGRAGA